MWPFCGRTPQKSAQDMKSKIQKGLAFLKVCTEDTEAKLVKENAELEEVKAQALKAIEDGGYTQARISAERYLLKQRQIDAWVLTIKRYDASKAKLENLWHTKVEEQSFLTLAKIFKGIQEATPDVEDRDLEAAEDDHIDFDEFTREIKDRVQDSVQHATMGDGIEEDDVERQLQKWGYDPEQTAAMPVYEPPVPVREPAMPVREPAMPVPERAEDVHEPADYAGDPQEQVQEQEQRHDYAYAHGAPDAAYDSDESTDPESTAMLAMVLNAEQPA